MSQSLNKIKRRISTIESTRKITSAMKLVSNAKMVKFKKELDNERLYIDYMDEILNDVIFYNEVNPTKKIDSIFLNENNNSSKKLYVLLTTDLGLCGAYNNEIFKFFKELYKNGDEVILIGTKGLSFFKKDEVKIHYDFLHLYENINVYKIKELTDFIVEKYKTLNYSSVEIIYHKYINTVLSIPKIKKLLPFEIKENKKMYVDPLFLPKKEEVVNKIIPEYINSIVLNLVYESMVSENSARRNAMENADQNAKDMIDDLKLEYNKERQQAITQEISEVIGGSK